MFILFSILFWGPLFTGTFDIPPVPVSSCFKFFAHC